MVLKLVLKYKFLAQISRVIQGFLIDYAFKFEGNYFSVDRIHISPLLNLRKCNDLAVFIAICS